MKKKFARWHVLYIHYIRRDWKKILIWIVLLGIFSGGFVPFFEEMAKGQGLIGMYETMKNPAMISMVGPTPAKSAAEYSLGAMYAQEMLLFCGLFAMIIQGLHVVNHSRKEEERGLLELIRSFQVGRQANSMAVMIEALSINGLLAVVTAVTMISFGADSINLEGALLFGISIGMAGMMGGIIALVMSQLNQASSGANGTTMGIIALMYILRGVTDVSNPDLSMLIPMGWTYLTYPFTENNWFPVLLEIVFLAAGVILAFVLEGRRDMGAGYMPVREGRARAKKSLLSISGLLFRLNKGVIIGWQIAFLILGAAYGSIYADMQTFLESSPLVQQMFAMTGISIEMSFTSVIMMVMAGLACVLPIAIVNKLFVQEEQGYLSQLYVSKVTRSGLYLHTIVLAVINAITGLFLSVVGLGGTALLVLEGKGDMTFTDFLAAGYNFLPVVLFFAGLSALLIGYIPRFAKASYIYLGYSFAINYFGSMLDLPEIIKKSAVLSWIPRMPAVEFDPVVFIVMTLCSIAMIVIGYTGYIRRDLIERV